MLLVQTFTTFILSSLLIGLLTLPAPSNSSAIYDSLVNCYRGNEIKPLFPNTLQLLIELIRKIEDTYPTTLDIRTLSTIILHRLRIDGIEREPSVRESEHVTPYGADGIMNPKFQLLLRMVSNVASNLELSRALTPTELCQLHRIISATVEPLERGDEHIVCPLQRANSTSIRPNRYHQIRPIEGERILHVSNKHMLSRCPIESGVIRTNDYGTFTPGTVIASIAAGLQPQSVPINQMVSLEYKRTPWDNLETMQTRDTEKELRKLLRSLDTMENTYSAGLAGDLAEICVYQGPYLSVNTSIGVDAHWNDTYLPRIRYLTHSHQFPRWEMTDSEILGGIDGLFMSQKLAGLQNHAERLKLSQVLDMYYSHRGLPFVSIENTNDGKVSELKSNPDAEQIFNDYEYDGTPFNTESNNKFRAIFDHPEIEWIQKKDKFSLDRFSSSDGITSACHRLKILEIIDRNKLKDETYFLSQVLQFSTSSIAISDAILRKNCDATVERFFNYSANLINNLPKCQEISMKPLKPVVDLTLIIDGSRNEFENLQLISFLAESIDVSKHGSYFSVIHGTTGERMVNRTQSVAQAFQQLRHFSGRYPRQLSLSHSMATHLEMISNQSLTEQKMGIITGLPQVLLIATQSHMISEHDFANARRMVQQSVDRFPDLYYFFLTNSQRLADDLIYGTVTHGDQRNTQYHVINENNIQIEHFERKLLEKMRKLPRRILAPFCTNDMSNRRRFEEGLLIKDYHEDYLTPNEELIYRISPYYLFDTTHIRVQFDGLKYGTFTVCMARNENFDAANCQTVSDYETVWFNLYDACAAYSNACEAAYFKISVDKSLIKCIENDCRYPDQVRFSLRQKGLRCESSSANVLNSKLKLIISSALIVVCVRLWKIYFVI